jgi:prevent-host-death family protein
MNVGFQRERAAVSTTTITGREFIKDPKRARKAAANGPVFITERGRHAFVLLTIEQYRRIGARGESILDLLAMPEAAEIDFEPPRLGDEPVRLADFS